MEQYFLLYSISFVAIIFALIQDIKTNEIANWLTFSLIAFVLAYRAVYSAQFNDLMFFVYGLGGVLLFLILGNLFYFSKVFGGGDAKLLYGLGAIFPYDSLMDYIYYGFGFILVLFTTGAVYTLVYSLFLARQNYAGFKVSLKKNLHNARYYFIISLSASTLFYIYLDFPSFYLKTIFSLFVLVCPLLVAYIKSIESSCMIKLVNPNKLTEGDWLQKEVTINGRKIKKNYNGLAYEEIVLLRKYKKEVWIKTGVPFAPAFLIALVIFLWYSSTNFFY